MVELSYTKPALQDLKNIFTYIANDSRLNARRFADAIKEHIKTLKVHPEKGRPIFPQKFPDLREVLYKSYRIIYSFDGTQILILVITHQSRLVSNIDSIKQYFI